MTRIRTFEEIESWKKARILTREIYRVTSAGAFARDFELKDQIRRAAVSILSNIAEGFERGGDRQFVQFLSVAKGSCGELRAQLYVALDQRYFTTEDFDALSQRATEVGQLLSGFMKYLTESAFRGSRFR